MNEFMMIKSFVDFYKRNKRTPDSTNATDPVEFGLDMWLKQQSNKHKKGVQLTSESVKILTESNLMNTYKELMHPNHHIQEAKQFVEVVTQRNIKEALSIKTKIWKRPRNWFYANVNRNQEVRDKVKTIFLDAGLPNLENSQLDSNELRQVVFIFQAINWFKQTKKLPNIDSKNLVESKLGKLLQSNELHSYSKFLLKHHGVIISKPSPILPAFHPETNKSDLDKRIADLETMVANLQKLVGDFTANMQTNKKKLLLTPSSNAVVAKKPNPEKMIDQSKLIGLAIVEVNGQKITAGIENVFAYPSGAKKYIMRMPVKNQEGMYDKKFWIWNSSDDIKEVTMTG